MVISLKEQFIVKGLDLAQPEKFITLNSFRLEAPLRIGHVDVFRKIEVGAFSYLHDGQLHAVTIGRFCSIGRRLVCLQPNHMTDWVSTHPFQHMPLDGIITPKALQFTGWDQNAIELVEKPHPSLAKKGASGTIIGHDVWIGTNVTLVNGVNIGSGAIIGAGSVVTRDVMPYAIVAGNPARFIRFRFDEHTRISLLESAWWNYDPAGYGKLKFNQPLEFVEGFIKLRNEGKLAILNTKAYLKNDFI